MKDWNGNYNSIYKTLGASNHTDKERQCDDFYATDPVAIDKLVAIEDFHKEIWECACGSAVAYAWYVWVKGYKGETTVEWI